MNATETYPHTEEKITNLVELTNGNWKEQVETLFSGNADYNGENGLDYVSEEAKAVGFLSNLEHAITAAHKLHGTDLKALVEDVYQDFLAIEGDYYQMTELQFLQIGNSLVAALSLVD